MEAKEKSLTFLRQEQALYNVPYFQRSYVWRRDNWEELWDELTSERKSCFLGSIILKTNTIKDGITYKEIIDGQQRLTTLTILLRAILDSKYKGLSGDDVSDYESMLFYKQQIRTMAGRKTMPYNRITHSRLDKKDYSSIIKGEYAANWSDIGAGDSQLLNCYKYFMQELSHCPDDAFERLENKLILDVSKILVVIDLNEDEDAQAIFDTINSAGVRLTSADIIKNALFRNVIDVDTDDDSFYIDTWHACFEKDEETVEKWLAMKGSGQNQRTYIDMFLQCFAIINGFFDPAKDTLSDIPKKYKKVLETKTVDEIKSFIKEICEYAKLYERTFIGFDSLTSYTFDDGKVRLLQILNTLKITTFDAYILKTIKELGEGEYIERFKKLEKYIIRNLIVNSKDKKSYNLENAALIAGNLDLDERLRKDEISDDKIKQRLKWMYNDPAKLILFWIELYLEKETQEFDRNAGLKYSFQLEHIMPQSYKKNWGVDALYVYNEDGSRCDDEEAANEIRNNALYEIGNMTLLTAKLNKELQNYSFTDKLNGKEIDGKFCGGIITFSTLLITKDVIAAERSGWDERTIRARTEKITDLFFKIW